VPTWIGAAGVGIVSGSRRVLHRIAIRWASSGSLLARDCGARGADGRRRRRRN